MCRSIFFALPFMGLILFLSLPGIVRSAEAGTYKYQSRFFTISYDNPDQLKKFARKVQPDALTSTLNKVFLGDSNNSNGTNLDRFIDRLFQRIQIILDMPMPKLHVGIELHWDQQEISEAYRQTMGTGTDSQAFYSQATNTIHLQVEKLSIGILAHEMAHAILDHFFVIRPPPKISEMLCQYVDKEISSGNF